MNAEPLDVTVSESASIFAHHIDGRIGAEPTRFVDEPDFITGQSGQNREFVPDLLFQFKWSNAGRKRVGTFFDKGLLVACSFSDKSRFIHEPNCGCDVSFMHVYACKRGFSDAYVMARGMVWAVCWQTFRA